MGAGGLAVRRGLVAASDRTTSTYLTVGVAVLVIGEELVEVGTAVFKEAHLLSLDASSESCKKSIRGEFYYDAK